MGAACEVTDLSTRCAERQHAAGPGVCDLPRGSNHPQTLPSVRAVRNAAE
ncbi:hypothetical protein NONI108955_36010 [Nocardia ninae]